MKKILFVLVSMAMVSWLTSCKPNNPDDPKEDPQKKDTTIVDPTQPTVVDMTIQAFLQVNATKAVNVLTSAGYTYARELTYSTSFTKFYGKNQDSILLNIVQDSVSYARYFVYGTGNTIQKDFLKLLELVGNTPSVNGVTLAFKSSHITSDYGDDFPRTYTALHDSVKNDNTIRYAEGKWRQKPYQIVVGGEFVRTKNRTRSDFTVEYNN